MNYLKLSKKISHVLRHAPEEFSLKMDRQGFVQIEQLLSGLNAHNHFGGTVGLSDLEYIIANSEKQRFVSWNSKKIRRVNKGKRPSSNGTPVCTSFN